MLFKWGLEMMRERLAEKLMPEMVIHATSKTIYALIVPGDSGGAIIDDTTQALPIAPTAVIRLVPEGIVCAFCEAIQATGSPGSCGGSGGDYATQAFPIAPAVAVPFMP
jgi:hypothetical protein